MLSKIFAKAMLNRLKPRADLLLRESKCSFRPGRGCADQLFSLRILMEKAREFCRSLYICFIDLKKAYDSVNRNTLWSILHHLCTNKAVSNHPRLTRGLNSCCQGIIMGQHLRSLLSPAVAGRVVCLLPPFLTSTLLWPFIWPWKTIRCKVDV